MGQICSKKRNSNQPNKQNNKSYQQQNKQVVHTNIPVQQVQQVGHTSTANTTVKSSNSNRRMIKVNGIYKKNPNYVNPLKKSTSNATSNSTSDSSDSTSSSSSSSSS